MWEARSVTVVVRIYEVIEIVHLSHQSGPKPTVKDLVRTLVQILSFSTA